MNKKLLIILAISFFLIGLAFLLGNFSRLPDINGDIFNIDNTEHLITYTDNGFDPQILTVPIESTVFFINNSSGQMWVASDPHPTHTDLLGLDQLGGVGLGGVYQYTFNQIGRWGYHNHLNPLHGGVIIVQ